MKVIAATLADLYDAHRRLFPMRLRVYAVFDNAIKTYNTPLCFRSEAEALRSFGDACREEGSMFKKHAPDYSFHHLGFYDDATGQFENLTVPTLAMTAIQGDVPF